MCLHIGNTVPHRKIHPILTAARPIFAALLAGLMLLLSLLTANDCLHRALYHSGKQANAPCFICLLHKGHVDSSTPAPVIVGPRAAYCWVMQAGPVFTLDVTYLLAPSRAPPAVVTPLPVLV